MLPTRRPSKATVSGGGDWTSFRKCCLASKADHNEANGAIVVALFAFDTQCASVVGKDEVDEEGLTDFQQKDSVDAEVVGVMVGSIFFSSSTL